MPLLQIHPEKVLEVPFTLYSSSVVQLTLRNVSPHPFVAYKIKTTAPKNYLVRPSTGMQQQQQQQQFHQQQQQQQTQQQTHLALLC